jgi:hypothetical protein
MKTMGNEKHTKYNLIWSFFMAYIFNDVGEV